MATREEFVVTRVYLRTEGSPLVTALTTSFTDGSDIKVERVTDFDPDEGVAVISGGGNTETITYTSINEATDALVGCSRPAPLFNWSAGTFVQAGETPYIEKCADGHLEEDETEPMVGVLIRPDLWPYYKKGPRDEPEYELCFVELDEDGSILEIVTGPQGSAEKMYVGDNLVIDGTDYGEIVAGKVTGGVITGGTYYSAPLVPFQIRIEIDEGQEERIRWLRANGAGVESTVAHLEFSENGGLSGTADSFFIDVNGELWLDGSQGVWINGDFKPIEVQTDGAIEIGGRDNVADARNFLSLKSTGQNLAAPTATNTVRLWFDHTKGAAGEIRAVKTGGTVKTLLAM